MIPILTKKEAVKLDELTITSGYNSEKELMNNAGKAVAKFVLENIREPFNQNILVIAGKGNNGGDAAIAHYYLLVFGCNSTLLVLENNILEGWVFEKYSIPGDTVIKTETPAKINNYSLIIDGIFGIGLSRKVTGKYLNIIKEISHHPSVISIDIASGIYCDSGNEADIAVNAMVTVTMGFPKPAHFINSGLRKTGILDTLDIGFKPPGPGNFYLIQSKDVSDRILIRPQNVNKFTRGKVLVIGGSENYPGAVCLAALAAYKTGAGYVKVVVPDSILDSVNLVVPEAVVLPFQKMNSIKEHVDWADAVILGPGIKMKKSEMNLYLNVLTDKEKPLILDAGGFEFLNGNYTISDLPPETILTPHQGELRKLFPETSKYMDGDISDFASKIRGELKGRACLLKGQPNFLITGDSVIYLMNHGRTNLATAGSGDVLSGILGGLAAQKYSIKDVMIIGSWIHAEAGKQFENQFGATGMTATDLLQFIPPAIQTTFDDR